jgi:hypothetical protein
MPFLPMLSAIEIDEPWTLRMWWDVTSQRRIEQVAAGEDAHEFPVIDDW